MPSVSFYSIPVANQCPGGEAIVLVNQNPNGSDLLIASGSAQTATLTCEKVIWENVDYFPEQDVAIHPGALAYFNPCVNNAYLRMEYAVPGGTRNVVHFRP